MGSISQVEIANLINFLLDFKLSKPRAFIFQDIRNSGFTLFSFNFFFSSIFLHVINFTCFHVNQILKIVYNTDYFNHNLYNFDIGRLLNQVNLSWIKVRFLKSVIYNYEPSMIKDPYLHAYTDDFQVYENHMNENSRL